MLFVPKNEIFTPIFNPECLGKMDFDELCQAEHIEVLERAAVDSQHRAVIGMRMLPNLLAEIAIYRIKRKA